MNDNVDSHMHNNCRKPILPIEMELRGSHNSGSEDDVSEESNIMKNCSEMQRIRQDIFSKADKNIKHAQERYKRDYDKKHHRKKV